MSPAVESLLKTIRMEREAARRAFSELNDGADSVAQDMNECISRSGAEGEARANELWSRYEVKRIGAVDAFLRYEEKTWALEAQLISALHLARQEEE